MEKMENKVLNALIGESSVQPVMETFGLNKEEANKIIADARLKLKLE